MLFDITRLNSPTSTSEGKKSTWLLGIRNPQIKLPDYKSGRAEDEYKILNKGSEKRKRLFLNLLHYVILFFCKKIT
jgi:hypothetical protein